MPTHTGPNPRTKEAAMTLTWWRFWYKEPETRDNKTSADWMLRRTDDRWLDDIGLTRDQLRQLLGRWKD